MARTVHVVVGLGSNLGDREASLRRALERIATLPNTAVEQVSPIYETPPAGGPPQGPYLNAAVLLRTSATARELLDALLAIERELGRVRPDAVRWGPRTIDLDILWIEGTAVDEPGLSVPHPRLLERPFALRPLLDVAPDARDASSGRLLAEMGTPDHRALVPVGVAPRAFGDGVGFAVN